MKKICVSTYCEWSSYGSIMQAIGLKRALGELGYESYIVRDTSAPKSTRKFPLVLEKNPKKLIRSVQNYKNRHKREKLYSNSVKFINENVDIVYYNDYTALKKNPPKADYYIAGSDQIWHPNLCKPAFFLDFVEDKNKRLTYATSMGVTKIPEAKREIFEKYVLNFQNISVREREMVDILSKFVDKDIQVNIDPTFLVDKETWRKYEKPYEISKPYILVYSIYWDSNLNKELKKLHKKTKYDVISLCPNGYTKAWSTKRIFDADPGQFLWLIDNAEMVVSSSFHGVAFSLIFNKRISAVINPASPSRISTLLGTLNASNVDISALADENSMKYDEINNRICEEKQKSMNYLREKLNENE